LTPGSVTDGVLERPAAGPATVTIEHPQGRIDVLIDYQRDQNGFHLKSAGLLRTARKLAAGEVFVPESVWTRS
jgi:2-methylaconitate cis-trans-isomerase PrpF